MTNMKVVDEPTNYGSNLLGYQQAGNPTEELHARVAPRNFSGPPHLSRLRGKCFSQVVGDYKYDLCPFANVTQHEHVLRWNAYSGILGVWQEWNIVNNTFVSMMMRNGDLCGERYRTAEVVLGCGNETAIESVSEPRTCEYVLQLHTPLVCHPDSLLVYPTLREEYQSRWDVIEGERLQGFLTDKGYNNRLHRLFVDAGYQVNAVEREVKDDKPPANAEKEGQLNPNNFLTLFECRSEYTKLERRVKELEEELSRLHATNITT